MSKISEHIGKAFQECRQKSNLTQSEVAEIADMEPRYISQIERGISKGSIDTLLKLCNAYKVTPDVILYDLLDKEVKDSIGIYDESFKKLSSRDKSTVNTLIEHLLNN